MRTKWGGEMSPQGRRALAAAVVATYFCFLLACHGKEAMGLVENFASAWEGTDAKEFSNALQRKLYSFARAMGFRKMRRGGWTDMKDPSPLNGKRRGLLRAALRNGHLWWLRERIPEDYGQEEELFLLETAGLAFVRPFLRAAGRHFYQVAVNYGFKRPRGSSSYIRTERSVSGERFGDDDEGESYDEAQARLAPSPALSSLDEFLHHEEESQRSGRSVDLSTSKGRLKAKAAIALRDGAWFGQRGNKLLVRCGLCGGPAVFKSATIDHIIPKSQGGTDLLGNLQLSHQACNRAKGSFLPPIRVAAERAAGKEVRR